MWNALSAAGVKEKELAASVIITFAGEEVVSSLEGAERKKSGTKGAQGQQHQHATAPRKPRVTTNGEF